MSDAIIGDSSIKTNELVASIVQRELITRAKLLPYVMDVSQYAVPGMKSIEFPYANSFSVTKKLSGIAVDASALTYEGDILSLDQHAVIQWLIEKKASIQSSVDLEMDAIQRASRAHAKQIDVDIIAELESGKYTTSVTYTGDTNTTLARTDINGAIEVLEGNDVPVDEGDCALLIAPGQRREIMDISDFIDASKFGLPVLASGFIGQIYGLPVVISNAVADGVSYVFHKEGLAFGFQSAPEYDNDKELSNLAVRHSIDQLYGVRSMQKDDSNGSPFIVKIYKA